MLKIKDSVDLKELEKFGFTYHKEWYDHRPIDEDNQSYYEFDLDDNRTYIVVGTLDREIGISTSLYGDFPSQYIDNLNVLFDLIKADLVEKVETNV
jgi:hypothetical protein